MKISSKNTGHKFSLSPQAEIPRSSFDRSHTYKTTFDSGFLIPFFTDEALPGDTFNLKMTAFARLATPIFPIMDNMTLDTFFFFVPNRLIWDNWEKFNGAQDDPGDSIDFVVPTMQAPPSVGFGDSVLADYMGIPTGSPDLEFDSLHMRAYNLIWNTWFRDENLQNSVVVDKDDGPDDDTDYVLLRRGKRHDYFTSALPWPQKGAQAVELPLGTSAPILGLGKLDQTFPTTSQSVYETDGTGTVSYADAANISNDSTNTRIFAEEDPLSAGFLNIRADLTNATAATINQLRQAFQIQKLLERDARGGTRYTEIVRSHFGVTSPDARLQRPEYLGGGSSPLIVSPVPQTSSTDATTPQGSLAALATAQIRGNGFTKSFTEHGVIIGLICARADLTYQQGLNRMWSRQTRYDFYWPALNSIGEQAVLNKEIYAQGSTNLVADAATWGFQERFAEYRYKPSQITGKFRSNAAGTLDAWHLAQDFASLPTLGATFIQETPPVVRVVAVTTEPDFIFDSFIQMRCARPMPLYGVPGLIDHF